MALKNIRERVLKLLPPHGLGLLKSLFLQTETRAKGVNAERFRVDNRNHKESVSELVSKRFIVSVFANTQHAQIYRLDRIALPLLDFDDSEKLLDCIAKIMPFLVSQYRQKLGHALKLEDIIRGVGADRDLIVESIFYLEGAPGVSFTPNFPLGDEAAVYVTEYIDDYSSLEDLLEHDLRPFEAAAKERVDFQNFSASLLEGEGGLPLGPIFHLSNSELHPLVAEVAKPRFDSGHHWDAVFAASKALVKRVKEVSGENNLDGAPLIRTVFSANKPVLRFNALTTPTMRDEQEGIMHLFEGAVLAIRNPGGHDFPTGSPQRAADYLSLVSLLMYLVDEANKVD